MGSIFILAFVAIPLIEIVVFIQIGDLIGLWWTLTVVIITAVAGTAMLRQQGATALQRATNQINSGRMPLREVFDGLCLIFAGGLLLTPGFVTDIAGGALLLPPIRALLRQIVAQHIASSYKVKAQAFTTQTENSSNQNPKFKDIIDGEFEEVKPKTADIALDKPNNTRKS